MTKLPAVTMPETGLDTACVSDHALLRYIERRHGVDEWPTWPKGRRAR